MFRFTLEISAEDLISTVNLFKDERYDKALKKAQKKLVAYAESQIGLFASSEVYSYVPKDPNAHIRRGWLLGGRSRTSVNKEELDKDRTKLEANSTLKGADFNYSPAVNDGTGWMKHVGARPFWTKAIDKTHTEGLRKAREEIKKQLK